MAAGFPLKKLGAILGVLSTLAGGATWVDQRYAKAEDVTKRVDQLERTVGEVALDLKLNLLQNRRTSLRAEQFQLKVVRQPTTLERARLFEVENELHDVEQQLELLRQGKR